MTVRVLIVDEHRLVREGIRVLLKCDAKIMVVGEAATGTDAIAMAHRLKPDIVLLDLLIPEMDGVAVISIMHREIPQTGILVLTSVYECSMIVNAIQAGAIGYLLKDVESADLRKSIKAAALGQMQLAPLISLHLLHEIQAIEKPEALTDREVDVLKLLARGYSNKEIACFLHVTEDTVKTHVHHLLAKLRVRRRTQAALAALRLGLIKIDYVV
jgi:NarL family two-component system response regulator LiaR